MKTEIRSYVLSQLSGHPNDIATVAANKFSVSRQTILNYLASLMTEGLITATGKTRARKYELKTLLDKYFTKELVPGMAEDILWREDMLPLMGDLNRNVIDICQYGFTEMVRNVFDHSKSKQVVYTIHRNATSVRLTVLDTGVGIFNKILNDLHLNDPRQALLELSKGKLTTDPANHTGEGIFFTSRMFDEFQILSNPLFYLCSSKDDVGWLMDSGKSDQEGTGAIMEISPYSTRTIRSVFDAYAPNAETYGFSRTHVPIKLAKYEGEQLVSRSQAKRLLARFDRFTEVILDFEGINMIGQSFADEIFRVYHAEHPTVQFRWVNAVEEVLKMILRAKSNVVPALNTQPNLSHLGQS